ncbi:MAG: uroporphyrinogen decarboxylase [Alphaproteobacteria bacterium]|nr:uroporphyrinogen decarboxylase [Alphaproteobacteria bacterium]
MSVGTATKPLLRALAGEIVVPPPWWLMRQAGRYLPEYRAVRGRVRSFVELCLNPALASELTLQPVRRFGMDAAILFSDILLLPYALGQALDFREGEGPVLDPVSDRHGVARLASTPALPRLEAVLETVRQVRAALGARTALIGFAGAPWTVATYMVEGGGSRDFRRVKGWAYRDPRGFGELIDLLTEATTEFLAAQIAAGAEVVQLFDSWAGVLPDREFARWVIEPTARIVSEIKRRHPDCPVIGFPRGAGVLYERYVNETCVAAVSLDTTLPADFACRKLGSHVALQGNLDPVLLLTGGDSLARAVGQLCHSFAGMRWVFNLGHGVLPETPPENVAALGRLLNSSLSA